MNHTWVKKTTAVLCFLLCSFYTEAAEEIEMADAMRQSGKIYVVVAVLTVIFLGIVLYLIALDRNIRKLEDAMKGQGRKTEKDQQ